MPFFILREEEQGCKTDLLDIHADKDMLNGLGEEKASLLTASRMIELTKEQVFPQVIVAEEGEACQAVNNGGDDGISERDNDDQRCSRP